METTTTHLPGGTPEPELEEVGDPKTIRDELEKLLDGYIESQCPFSFHRAYPDAPNPGLQLSDLGSIGFPLGTEDADKIRLRVTHDLYIDHDTREGSAVKSEHRVWELSTQKFTAGSPLWPEFLTRVAQDICEGLDIDYNKSKPRCKLQNLFLCDQGSLPPLSQSGSGEDTTSNVFASFMVVLLSRSTGGAIEISHAGITTTFDCSASSHYQPHVVAWYTGATCLSKPITDGNFLVLSYQLVHTTSHPCPTLTINVKFELGLRRVMQTWKRHEGRDTPNKLLYLLKDTYPAASLRLSALQGVDAQKAALVENAAKEFGLRVGLGDVSWVQAQNCNSVENNYGLAIGGSFGCEMRGETKLARLVDMEGHLISTRLNFSKCEAVPEELADIVETGYTYDGSHEGYKEAHGCCSPQNHRTVLLIWSYSTLYTGDNFLLDALADFSAKIERGGVLDAESVDQLLRWCQQDPKLVVPVICKTAIQNNDAQLWTQTVTSCCLEVGLAVLPEDSIQASIEQFGWEVVKEGLDVMIHNDPHNAPRLQFLADLENRVASSGRDEIQKAAIIDWVSDYRHWALRNLRRPVTSEIDLMLSYSKSNGGFEFLKDIVLPQLIPLADDEFLREFATAISDDTAFDREPKSATVSTLLDAAINKIVFETDTVPSPEAREKTIEPTFKFKPSLDLVLLYIKRVDRLGYNCLTDNLVEHITTYTSTLGADDAADYARELILPLMGSLVNRSQTQPPIELPSNFKRLQEIGVTHYLEWLTTRKQNKWLSYAVKPGHLIPLLDASLASNGAEQFVDAVLPRLIKLDFSGSHYRELALQMAVRRHKFPGSSQGLDSSIQSTIHQVAKLAIERNYTFELRSVPGIKEAFSYLYKINASRSLHEMVIGKVIDSHGQSLRPTIEDQAFVDSVLIPLLTQLRTSGTWLGRNTDHLCASIVCQWARKNLRKPTEADVVRLVHLLEPARDWNCSCRLCDTITDFLLDEGPGRCQWNRNSEWLDGVNISRNSDSITLIRTGISEARKHVEEQVSRYAVGIITCVIDRTTRPHSLQIERIVDSYSLRRAFVWQKYQQMGRRLIDALGSSEDERRRVLGQKYDEVMAARDGELNDSQSPSTGDTSVLHRFGSFRARRHSALEHANNGRSAKRLRAS